MEIIDSQNDKLDILKYWTLVEFFSPYLLEPILGSKQHYQRVFAGEKSSLPWEGFIPLAEDDPINIFAKGYHLYLGLFSTEESADRARHVFHEKPGAWQSIDWRQCGSPANVSCFARLTVTKFGTPLLGTLSLSTLPWAHGRLLNDQLKMLTIESYWKGVQRLLTDLREMFAEQLPKELVRMPNEHVDVLDYQAICNLTETLFNWAGYAPTDYPIALIEPTFGDEKKAAREPKIESERDIPILNSFYIQELERAAASLDFQKENPLDLYLSGKGDQQISLRSQRGKAAIIDALAPSRFPKGRWPANRSNKQALMQQFAINHTLESVKEKGLFSVNGPPGTGKTTLLREIVAENMVERASALAQFEEANQAFVQKRAIGFGDGDSVFVSNLHPSLLGYEMLVVSSNNTAVQNLSHELPLQQELDPAYRSASYLEPVVRRLLGLEEEQAWGLISAALGNVKNCQHLVEKVFISRDDQEKGMRIWDWAQDYDGPSFSDAKDQFLSLQIKQKELLDGYSLLATLHKEVVGGKLQSHFNSSLQELVDTESEAAEIEDQLRVFREEGLEVEELIALLEKRVELWNKERPGVTERLLKGKRWSEWSEKATEYTQKQIAAVEELHAHKDRIRKLRKKLEEIYSLVESKEFELFEWTFWMDFRRSLYKKLQQTYPDISVPEQDHEFDDPEIQKRGYFQSETFNQIRSELFIAAMALHEAWLAETLKPKGGFRGNLMVVSKLLQGKNPTTTDDTRLAWQSIFLLIPLLSSTFASIGRLFRYLEPQSIGWVFIDEAGQALPQAAVGVIWRAKRVLSIGDPFQIEPISTISPEVVDGMAKHRLQDHCLSWAPSQISVQNLMDLATRYGTERSMREVSYWLGAPLRVHRRCIEPMFSIANEIAYENSMVLATPPEPSCPLRKSCWYDVKGSVTDRQYVPSQGAELLRRLTEALGKMHVPDLFVISPFREIVLQLQNLMIRDKLLEKFFENRFNGTSFRAWVRESIGTVHSFQGKQATAIFFILGADQTTFGAIEWATRKPNLLNVAVTRARLRFYVIGDYHLWRRWPYFDVAASKLEKVSGLNFTACV